MISKSLFAFLSTPTSDAFATMHSVEFILHTHTQTMAVQTNAFICVDTKIHLIRNSVMNVWHYNAWHFCGVHKNVLLPVAKALCSAIHAKYECDVNTIQSINNAHIAMYWIWVWVCVSIITFRCFIPRISTINWWSHSTYDTTKTESCACELPCRISLLFLNMMNEYFLLSSSTICSCDIATCLSVFTRHNMSYVNFESRRDEIFLPTQRRRRKKLKLLKTFPVNRWMWEKNLWRKQV